MGQGHRRQLPRNSQDLADRSARRLCLDLADHTGGCARCGHHPQRVEHAAGPDRLLRPRPAPRQRPVPGRHGVAAERGVRQHPAGGVV